MSAQAYPREESELRDFFGAVARIESYLNILYLFLSFPLGILYFVLLTTGIALGFGLLIIWIGFPILILVLAGSRALASWERQLANWLLDAAIPPVVGPPILLSRPWNALKAMLGDTRTWKGMLFLFLKFPFGIFSFVLTVTLISVSLALILVPVSFRFVPITVGPWDITSPDGALLCLALGILLAFVSVFILNGIATVWRALASTLLSPDRVVSSVLPARRGPVVIP
jgi:hypothetical protein